jgi:hypothetical protein
VRAKALAPKEKEKKKMLDLFCAICLVFGAPLMAFLGFCCWFDKKESSKDEE